MRRKPTFLDLVLGLAFLPLLVMGLLLFVPAFLFSWGYHLLLRLAVELLWGTQNKRILLVYSRSPVWQSYIETHWLPQVQAHAVILNRSDRAKWGRGQVFASLVFRHWCSRGIDHPMAVLFPRLGKARRLGFFYAFRDWKHGKEAALRESESQLLGFASELGSRSA